MSKTIPNCHMAGFLAEEMVRAAEKIKELIEFRDADAAIILMDDLIEMTARLNKSARNWGPKFKDDYPHGTA